MIYPVHDASKPRDFLCWFILMVFSCNCFLLAYVTAYNTATSMVLVVDRIGKRLTAWARCGVRPSSFNCKMRLAPGRLSSIHNCFKYIICVSSTLSFCFIRLLFGFFSQFLPKKYFSNLGCHGILSCLFDTRFSVSVFLKFITK